jgi:hypothetical protein
MASQDNNNRSRYLKSGVLYFVIWLFVAFFLYSELKDEGGVSHILRSAESGNYSPILLLVLSIVLFAYALKSIAAYFKVDRPE